MTGDSSTSASEGERLAVRSARSALQVNDTTVGRSAASIQRPNTLASATASTAASRGNGFVAGDSSASARSSRAPRRAARASGANTTRRALGEDAAESEHRTAPNGGRAPTGDQLALAAHISATAAHAPSRTALASSSAAARDGRSVGEPESHIRARLVRNRVTAQLHDDREADLGRSARRGRPSRSALRRDRHAVRERAASIVLGELAIFQPCFGLRHGGRRIYPPGRGPLTRSAPTPRGL